MKPDYVPLRRLLIAQALRRYRQSLGYTLRDAAAVMSRHPSALCRAETGQRGIRPAELGELLSEYAVPSPEREVLLRLAEPGPPKWLGRDARLLPAPLAEYLAVEQFATELVIWAPCLIPDLIQVPCYTQAVLSADIGCDNPDAAVRAAEARREAIAANPAVMADVIIGETALWQEVATAPVRIEQARSLASANEGSLSVAIRVMPLSAGAHPLTGYGPFTIARLGAPDLTVVYLPGPCGGTCLTGTGTAHLYLRVFQLAKSQALSAQHSTAFLHALDIQ